MEKDYSKLRGRIIEVCGSLQAFAAAMGWSGKTNTYKLNGSVDWTQPQIEKACDVLHIEAANIPDYFFCYSGQNKFD